MEKILVIVESPGKIKKIEEYLNSLKNGKYIVKASFGHCRDLNSKELSIDVDNNFEPQYNIIPGKEKVVRELRGLVKDCSMVLLAADEDREGEMIAASLKDVLKLKGIAYVQKYPYGELAKVSKNGKRHYATPDGRQVPSVTTVLSATKDMTHLHEWRKRVGKGDASHSHLT